MTAGRTSSRGSGAAARAGNTASGLSYLEAKTVMNGESYLVAARFDDEYARVGGEWKFRSLKLSLYFAVPLREGWAGENRIQLPG